MDLEPSLDRWVAAQLLSPDQAAAIRAWEQEHAPQSRSRLPILLGLAFGGLMVATGILLFVSAHWADLSPSARMMIVVGALAALHAAGAWFGTRLPALSATLHGAGSVALGGGIYLAGQIFNMEGHWPTAVLLWALGCIAGWLLVRQWPQLALAAVLVPWWLSGEWLEMGHRPYLAMKVVEAGLLLLAICYLSVRRPGQADEAPIRAFAWIGGLTLLPLAAATAIDHPYRHSSVSTAFPFEAWAVAVLVPLAFAFWFRRKAVWMNAAAALWTLALAALAETNDSVFLYLWCALGAAGLIAWGVYELRPERINLGMAGFALTLLCFYFSSVMDKLGRSVSLILLGLVFLGGGWYGERFRRGLIARVREGGAQ